MPGQRSDLPIPERVESRGDLAQVGNLQVRDLGGLYVDVVPKTQAHFLRDQDRVRLLRVHLTAKPGRAGWLGASVPSGFDRTGSDGCAAASAAR